MKYLIIIVGFFIFLNNAFAFSSIDEIKNKLNDAANALDAKFADLKDMVYANVVDSLKKKSIAIHSDSNDESDSKEDHFEEQINEDEEIVLVQALWRHGEQNPLRTFKMDPNQADTWPPGLGELTTKGMEEMFNLGVKLRKRYIEQLGFINATYRVDEIYVRSTDWNCTLTSAISNLIGFYVESSNGKRPMIGQPTVAKWPRGYYPIPIHTVKATLDYLGDMNPLGQLKCPRRSELFNLLTHTPEYRNLMDKNENLFNNLSKFVDEEINMKNIGLLADLLIIEKAANRKLSQWYTPQIFNAILELLECRRWFYGQGLQPYNGVNFSAEFPRVQGGVMLWHFIDQMQAKVKCREHQSIFNKNVSPECEWIDRLKYYAFSAILYWDPEKIGYEYITDTIDGCESEPKNQTYPAYGNSESCGLNRFAQRSLRYKPQPNIEELCANQNLDENMKIIEISTEVHSNIAKFTGSIHLILMGLIMFTFFYFNKLN